MLGPMLALDFELTAPFEDLRLVDRYTAARVLVRMHGTPLGSVDVPIVAGALRRSTVLHAIVDRLHERVAEESIRRSLLCRGVPAELDLRDVLAPGAAHAPASSLHVTVAVCTRDRPDDAARCLSALEQIVYDRLDVVVVDNAPSTDATARLVAERFPWARYVREDTPGLDHARNRAILSCRPESDVIAYADDDVRVDQGWIGAIAGGFAADPAAGCVTGLVVPAELEHEAQLVFEAYGGFGKGFRRRRHLTSPTRPLPWHLLGAGQFGTGANMAFRLSIFRDIGLFDPALDVGTKTNGGGDLEMFMRVLKGGWALVYEPRAIVRHRHRRTMPELERQLTDHGLGFRSYLERARLMFPDERAGLRRITRWWWRHWGLRHLVGSLSRPSRVPRGFRIAEIRGFRDGRGRYASVRQALGIPLASGPDRFVRARGDGVARPPGEGGSIVVPLDVAQPLEDLVESVGYDEAIVAAHWNGRPIGRVTIPARRQAVAAADVADRVAEAHWPRLLNPGRDLPLRVSHTVGMARLAGALLEGVEPDPAGPATASVSIVVATRDRPDDLRRALRSLVALDDTYPIEIIVVDNNPASGLTAPVVREFQSITLVDEARAGLSYARNAGIAVATGDIIAMTDDDVVTPRDWITRLVAPFGRSDVLAVTGNVLPGRLRTQAERSFEQYGGLGRGFERQEYNAHWFHRFRRSAVPTWRIGATANAAFRASIFTHREIGPMDEVLGPGSPTGVGEDTLVFYRILLAGGTIVYEPAAWVWHYHRSNTAALSRQLYAYSKGHVAYHLRTVFVHGDGRGLIRIFVELPLSVAHRVWSRARRRTTYSWRLLGVEVLGFAAGPFALWQSIRRQRRLGEGARRSLHTLET